MNLKRSITPRQIVWVIVVLVLLATVPSSLRYAHEHGGFYLFSNAFLQDLPKRLKGPGRLRFIFQPLVATFLGIRAGIADARAGRPPYILGLITGAHDRLAVLREAFLDVATLVAVAILLDCISQLLILRQVFPGPALLVGPVLIALPYSWSRALANRVYGTRTRPPAAP